MSERTPAGQEYIPSLEKGLAVIGLFSAETSALTLSQIASKLKLTPGSARRVLRTLETLGYLTCAENRFSLTTRVLQLGFAYLSSQPIAKVMQPVLMEMAIPLQIENRTIAALVTGSTVGQVTVAALIEDCLPVLREAADRLAQLTAVLV